MSDAFLASPMALMAISAPLFITSPPAKIPGIFVANVDSSAAIVPFLVFSMASKPSRLDCCPIAPITRSTSSISNSPSIGTGLLLPLASSSPSSIFCNLILATLPSSAIISSGATRNLKSTPSSLASRISISSAGISASVLLYNKYTFLAPSLTAVLQASIAVFPPPTTATLSPIFIGILRAAFLKKSIPPITPGRSSPFTLKEEDFHAPTEIYTASKFFLTYSKSKSLPTLMLFIIFAPIFSMIATSSSITAPGRRYSGIPYLSIPPI